MNLSNYEKETEILYNQEENTALVATWHKALINKLRKIAAEREDITCKRDEGEYAEFIVPKTWIKISPPPKRNLTDEQRAAMAERLAAARNKAKS